MFGGDGGLLPGLLPGFWRGIRFHVPDASTAAGRRITEQLFPGVDLPAYDDFGVAPAVISIEGLMVGDDYIAKAAALQAAMETPGLSTLVHPWLGPMTVMLEEPGQIYFSDRELRVTRFSVQFKRMPIGGLSRLGNIGSSLSALTTAIAVAASAIGAMTAAHEKRSISAARQLSVTRSHRVFRSAVSAIAAPSEARRTLPRLKASVPDDAPTGATAFDTMVSATVAILSAADLTSAVSPAAGATAEIAPSPLALMTMAFDLGAAMGAAMKAAPSSLDGVLLAIAAGRALVAGSSQSLYASYESRREALAYRLRANHAIDAAMTALEGFTSSIYAGEASDTRRALGDVQNAIAVDINERIGRLPDVMIVQPDTPIEAWQIAHHLFGDQPDLVEAAYRDIVRRNRPRHPAYMEGAIEVLK